MLGKRLAEKLIQLIHDKSNDAEYMLGEMQASQNKRLDVIEQLLRDLVAMDTMTEEVKSADYYRDKTGLYSYKAHENKMREYYDRPRDKE